MGIPAASCAPTLATAAPFAPIVGINAKSSAKLTTDASTHVNNQNLTRPIPQSTAVASVQSGSIGKMRSMMINGADAPLYASPYTATIASDPTAIAPAVIGKETTRRSLIPRPNPERMRWETPAPSIIATAGATTVAMASSALSSAVTNAYAME